MALVAGRGATWPQGYAELAAEMLAVLMEAGELVAGRMWQVDGEWVDLQRLGSGAVKEREVGSDGNGKYRRVTRMRQRERSHRESQPGLEQVGWGWNNKNEQQCRMSEWESANSDQDISRGTPPQHELQEPQFSAVIWVENEGEGSDESKAAAKR